QYTALFSLIGTSYGGDGRTTFGLPDFRGRFPMHAGTGPGLTYRPLGQKSGSESITLTTQQLPSHNHDTPNAPINFSFQMNANSGTGTSTDPTGNFLSQSTGNLYTTNSGDATLEMGRSDLDLELDETIQYNGGNQEHSNMQPYQTVSFIIALVGVYPTRN
ncbi:MAG: tail fiber protein, partial [Phaeodactylibacter sp.]|nr:tail fiber protein [Phaeodactylibacter sp.]